jgi:predicted AlkP superfamily pyrophosphatase or phosphodiesterase
MFFKFSVAFLAAFACITSANAQTAPKPHVVMISIDGMKPEYVTHADEHGLKIPTLRRFLTEGTYAEGVQGVIPTVTYPSHTTMVTGVWPAEHGILANTTFDPMLQHKGEWYWYFSALKSQTLYQAADAAGLTTAAIGWPVTVGAPIDYLIAEFGQSEKLNLPAGQEVHPADLKDRLGVTLPANADGDEKKTAWTVGIIRKYNPNFVLAHLTNLDHQEHLHSPFSPEANSTLEVIDGEVKQIIDTELAADPDAKIVIVSDHGFVRVDHHVLLNVLFVHAGLIKLGPKVDGEAATIASWDAQAWESGGTAAIMIHAPVNTTEYAETRKRVAAVLARIATDPAYGVDRVIEHDQVVQHGGNPDAAFVVDFKPGWAAAGGWRGAALKDAPGTGTHGYLPDHPELRSTFMVMGKGVVEGKNLGLIDMRQIAPSVAQMLGVKLTADKLAPVKYSK